MTTGVLEYERVRRVLKADIEGERKYRVLGVIAAYLDEGYEPSLREIKQRAKINSWQRTAKLIRRLEDDGHIRVKWVSRADVADAQRAGRPAPRNEYKILV